MKARRGAWLDISTVERIRKNHALEHATIHVLSEYESTMRIIGRSDARGFTLYGYVINGEVVKQASRAALQRLRSGERHLALHPNCGTNFVTAGLFASLAALVTYAGSEDGWRARLERVPLLVCMITVTLILAQPIGMVMQRNVTTKSCLGELEIVSVTRRQIGALTLHRVETRE